MHSPVNIINLFSIDSTTNCHITTRTYCYHINSFDSNKQNRSGWDLCNLRTLYTSFLFQCCFILISFQLKSLSKISWFCGQFSCSKISWSSGQCCTSVPTKPLPRSPTYRSPCPGIRSPATKTVLCQIKMFSATKTVLSERKILLSSKKLQQKQFYLKRKFLH